MLNTAIIMGRLTADPELRTTNTGLSVTSFTVAVDRSYAKQGEQKQTDFINCVAWRQNAEFITKYFQKGSMIAVQGSIQVRSYDDRNGVRRTATEIVVSSVSFCGSKAESGSQGTRSAAPQQSPAAYQAGSNEDFSSELPLDDELPF